MITSSQLGKIAVGIITFNNSPDQISNFAGSLDNAVLHSGRDMEEVVFLSIANGAPDNWPTLRIQHSFLASSGNVGFAAAANKLLAAAKHANCSALILANPDGMFHHSCLKYLFEAHRKAPEDLLEARQFPEEHPKHYDPHTGLTNWSSGACMLIPMSCYEKIGGMDERFFLYMEDVDFSWRARAAGFCVRVVPKALFSHNVIGREDNPVTNRHSLASQLHFFQKWQGPNKFIARIKAELASAGSTASLHDKANEKLTAVHQAIRDFSQPYFGKGRW